MATPEKPLDPSSRIDVSSSKCDFTIRSNNLNLRGIDTPDHFDLRGKLPSLSARLDSNKCDWRIVTDGMHAFGQTPDLVDELRAKLPGGSVRVDSSKCDWHIDSRFDDLRTSIDLSVDDWSIKGGRPGATGTVASSKCDFRLSSNVAGRHAQVESFRDLLSLRARTPDFRGEAVSSSKCDFRLTANVEQQRASVHFDNARLRIDASGLATGSVSSSKCDWRVEALGGLGTLTQRPRLDARLGSDKCDFTLDLEFGLTKGAPIRIRAVSSSKCDFRIESFEAPRESIDPEILERPERPRRKR